ncbi:MAG: DUF4399 domain-containing protein [Gemmatimonadota bacterium]
MSALKTLRTDAVWLLVALAAACGGERSQGAAPATEAAAEPSMSVRLVEPQDGDTVEGPVRVVFEVTGLDIVPAGTEQPRSGHHHLLVDVDLPPAGQPVPSTAGYLHFGQAQTEATLEDLAPGVHRLIAVVADFAHVPLQPLVVDTVHVTVR